MGMDVFPRFVSELPQPGANLLTGHPLLPDFGWIFSMNTGQQKIEELRRQLPAATYNTSAAAANRNRWRGGRIRGRAGMSLEFPARTGLGLSQKTWVRLANTTADVDRIFPSKNVTIALNYRAMTAPAVSAFILFGSAGGAGQEAYFRGDTAGALQFGWSSDPEIQALGDYTTLTDDSWVLVASKSRGMETWQNGIKTNSDPTRTATRTQGGQDSLYLGLEEQNFVRYNGTHDARWAYFYVYHRVLTTGEIVQLTKNPFPFVTVL